MSNDNLTDAFSDLDSRGPRELRAQWPVILASIGFSMKKNFIKWSQSAVQKSTFWSFTYVENLEKLCVTNMLCHLHMTHNVLSIRLVPEDKSTGAGIIPYSFHSRCPLLCTIL